MLKQRRRSEMKDRAMPGVNTAKGLESDLQVQATKKLLELAVPQQVKKEPEHWEGPVQEFLMTVESPHWPVETTPWDDAKTFLASFEQDPGPFSEVMVNRPEEEQPPLGSGQSHNVWGYKPDSKAQDTSKNLLDLHRF
ncbi:UNVERIFIED_CONTAM: hypothetical protein K2H54_062534 [Gekko kuhli]